MVGNYSRLTTTIFLFFCALVAAFAGGPAISTGGGSGASSAELTAHMALSTDAHGASETVTQYLQVGSNATATTTAYIYSIASCVVRIASYAQIVPEIATPTGCPNGTIWYNSARDKLEVMAGGSWVDLH